jgi:hypothetical protein
MRSRLPLYLALAAAAALVGAGCRSKPLSLTVSSPIHGTFTTAASVTVTGTVSYVQLGEVVLTVNGAPIVFGEDGSFSTSVPLDPAKVFNPIHVIASAGGRIQAERIVVIAGESVADGDYSLESVALRLNDTGLDSVEPLVSSLVDLDIASLLPVGTVIIDNECMIDGGFLGCLGRATVSIQNPPPSFSSFGLNTDSMVDFVYGDVQIDDVRVDAYINGSGLVPDCGIRLTANTVNIDGDYTLSPDAVDPTTIDVNLSGSPGVSFSGFNDQFTSGACDDPIIGDIIQLIIGDIQPIVINGLVDFLADPDGSGPVDAPIAEGIETALAGIEISGPIGQGLGVNLETPMFAVTEDHAGLTLGSDGRVTASFGTGPGECEPPANAPDLLASYHVPEPFPTFGATTPGGGLPYGLGICISTSAFNQLLKAQIECGLLQAEITEIDLFSSGTPSPITAGLLALLFPEFGGIDPATPLKVSIVSTLAPVLTGNPGPLGEDAEMRVGGLLVSVVATDGSEQVLVSAGVDFAAGLDFDFDDLAGELVPTLGAVAAENVDVGIIDNAINTNPTAVSLILEALLPGLLPQVADVLAAFPLPAFLGLELQAVEVGNNGEFISIFADLVSAP